MIPLPNYYALRQLRITKQYQVSNRYRNGYLVISSARWFMVHASASGF